MVYARFARCDRCVCVCFFGVALLIMRCLISRVRFYGAKTLGYRPVRTSKAFRLFRPGKCMCFPPGTDSTVRSTYISYSMSRRSMCLVYHDVYYIAVCDHMLCQLASSTKRGRYRNLDHIRFLWMSSHFCFVFCSEQKSKVQRPLNCCASKCY